MEEFDFKQKVIDGIDIIDLIEILEITPEDIYDRFEVEIMNSKYHDICEYLNIDSEPIGETEELD